MIAALGIITVTFIAVGLALSNAQSRFRTGHHSSRWSQAGHAAEAGVEVALLAAQKNSWAASGWSAAPGSPGAPAVTKTVSLSEGGSTSGPVSAAIAVDKLDLGTGNWLRIRSTGSADIAGGALAGIDEQDTLLRKLSLKYDRRNGGAVLATPRATRVIEVLAEPARKSPFTRMLLLNKKFTMAGSAKIDSFDSGDPTKSTNGFYDRAKRQSNGDVGVNDTQGLSDLRDSTVRGDVAYSGPAIQNTDGVTGVVSTPFNVPTPPVPTPTWTTFNATPTIINNSMTLSGGTQSNPARYKVSELDLTSSRTLNLVPHTAGQQSYVEIWITGNFTTTGNGEIRQQNGVHVIYHIEGNVSITGSSFVNQSNTAEYCILNCVNPPPGTTRTVNVSGSGDFVGAINAPGADFTVWGSAQFYGALIGRTMDIRSSADLHYDEALARASNIGIVTTYLVRSFVEAVR